jgi:hypothetical protein
MDGNQRKNKCRQTKIGYILAVGIFLFYAQLIFAQAAKVEIISNKAGMKLLVDGKDFMINGMNWDYIPIGANYMYSLWKQPDDIIKAALDEEMLLLKNMGINAIRLYTGIPAKWITYIYDNYGIYTMLNHSFGRYGLTLDGIWVSNTEYAEPRVRELLLKEVTTMVNDFKDTRGLLMFLLGNENNYGLFWDGAETEDIPLEDRKSTKRARHMYQLFNEATQKMKALDADHPVAICNGDLLFLEIIKEECKDIDILATNMYRGISFRDAFQRVKDELNKPILFSEFGADAFNAVSNEEDQKSQAYYMAGNWQEIYENAYGLGKAGNSIGGFTFQFSDGWWKFGQTKNLSIHDNNASWSNGGYQSDYVHGENNMNEEWFGICAKGPNDARGLYTLYPRAAYYALKEVHKFNPYASWVTADKVKEHFSNIKLIDAVMKARGDKAAYLSKQTAKIRVSGMRVELSTFSTGGDKITTPKDPIEGEDVYPNATGFDHMQSFYTDIEAKPTESVRGTLSLNVLGNVAANPIDEIFYENRGRSQSVKTADGETQLNSLNRVTVYKAGISWNHNWFNLEGFYRTGHYHWGYEGDFFGLYREANYGPNIDMYNGIAPLGFEMEGKKNLKGLKIAFGPELWWGANPAILVKYGKEIGTFKITGIFHEEVDEQSAAVSSIAIPAPPTRRATLHIETKIAGFGVELGGIWAGQPRVGETFQLVRGGSGNYTVYEDKIKDTDTWGAKIKLTYSIGPVHWYMQGAAMGLVAGGGSDQTQTYTGWRLKDSGSGNQMSALTGFAYSIGNYQIAPNFLWQKPIEGPVPSDAPAPARPRNFIDDPFAVRANREMTAAELLITYDPTPASWMYVWDSDMIEDAPLAISAGFVYRHQPTTMDAAPFYDPQYGILKFPGATPARDIWEAHARIVSKVNSRFGFIANLYGGEGEPNGDDDRLIHRWGGDLRMILNQVKLTSIVKVNDWGPYDYHRDHNQTFPLQLMADISTSAGKQNWFDFPNTRIGIRYTWRSLDQYSNRYAPAYKRVEGSLIGELEPDPTAEGYDDGNEWEIRTYLQFSIGSWQ